MAFDFNIVKKVSETPKITDPIQLFRSLKVKDNSINDMWLAQAEALKPWHEKRDLKDVAISLNTGAGKTLVGLLIAQSLVNETKGKVLYACNSIQLVEQTRDKALGYGLETTTYFQRNFSNNLYTQGKAPCITTYQALFNGRSIFCSQEIDAIIFDDAHTADSVLRDSFSLGIKANNTTADAYRLLAAEFRDYFHSSGIGTRYDEVINTDTRWTLILPPFEVRKNFSRITHILKEANLHESVETCFAWEHLKDHLNHCVYILSAGAITITPAITPVRTLPYFQNQTRRIYLSATLDAEDGFTRTFGKSPEVIIAPETTAGACERLILIPKYASDRPTDEIATTCDILKSKKALILAPTYRRGERWTDIATPPEREDVTAAVNRFKASNDPDKLLLTARYDGVDLPGETCRVMVIDDLPSNTNPLENFMWEFLRTSNSMRTTIASRVVQCFGRISRGMSDHGVVIITGQSLIDWLATPKNQQALPEFLQKQLSLGFFLSEQMASTEISGVIDQALKRDPNWIANYEQHLDQTEIQKEKRNTTLEAKLAKAEAKYASAMWKRKYDRAASVLSHTLADAHELSANTAAWHQFLIAMATELGRDNETAHEMYHQAHSSQPHLPAPLSNWSNQNKSISNSQVLRIADCFIEKPVGVITCPKNMDRDLEPLISSGTSGQVEEAVRVLGNLLGFVSTRPDKEEGSGPDNLWTTEKTSYCIECKSDKSTSSVYRKKNEIGQMADHVEWVKNHTDSEEIIPLFVGPKSPASDDSNPPKELLVITLEDLGLLARKTLDTYRDISNTAIPLSLKQQVDKASKANKLLHPEFLDTLNPAILCEIEKA